MQQYLLSTYEPRYSLDNVMILIQHTEIFKTTPLIHWHDFYEVTLVEDGNSIHCINEKFVPLGRGNLTFIRPADRHCYMSYRSDNFTMINVRFSCEDYERLKEFMNGQTALLEETELPVTTRVAEPVLKLLSSRLRAINELPTSKKRGAMVKTVLCDIMFELLNADEGADPMPEWFSKILELIAQNFKDETDISEIAKSCGVSREHMCRSFRKYLNVTPSQYINSLRLQEAARLLSKTEKPIIEISNEVGFNNPSYFYRLFGEYFNVSPREYRLKKLEAFSGGDKFAIERIMLK